MANDAEVQPAPRQNEVGSSIGRFRVWVREKPWHLWVTVAIGILGIYITIRLYQSRNQGNSGGFFAGLGGPATSPINQPPPGTPPSNPPTAPKHWWDALLHSKGNPGDTDLTDPANSAAEGYATVGASGVQGNTLARLAAFFGVKVSDLLYNPANKGLPRDPNAILASGTEVWITRSTMQS